MEVPRLTGFAGRVPFRLSVASAALYVVLAAGCSSDEPIVVETVPKDETPTPPVAAAPASTDRMLAAILPHGDSAWFFKLTGPDEAVAGAKGLFLDLVRSVRFDGGQPKWSSPEGWTERGGNAMRLATLVSPGDPPLEIAVSSLPYQGDDRTGYLLANVNRWRGQMGLPPMEADKLHKGGDPDDETQELELADGTKATLVSLKGQLDSGSMTPPFAGSGFAPPAAAAAPRQPAGDSPVKYELPEGWKFLGADGISLATFTADGEGGTIKVTTTPLPASNDLVANVSRWRDQVGLPPAESAEIESSLKTVTLGDGEEGKYVTLIGPGDPGSRKAILGVIAVRNDTAWFVKLTAPAEAALREQAKFESFVRTLRLPTDG